MKLEQFLEYLKRLNISVALSSNRGNLEIKYQSEGEISKEILARLKRDKNQILEFLEKEKTSIPNTNFSAKGYPITPSQKRSWIINQIDGYDFANNMYEIISLEGDVDVKSMQRAFSDLIERHEILRTIFRENKEGEIRQYVLDQGNSNLEYYDLREEKINEQTFNEVVLEKIHVVFDLTQDPIIKCYLYRLEDNKWFLVIVNNHIIADSKSYDVIKRDLLALYTASLTNLPNPLPPVPLQYKDFAIWKNKEIQTDKIQKQRTYWLQEFSGELPVLELNVDKTRLIKRNGRSGSVKKKLNKPLLFKFKKYCLENNATLFTGLMSLLKLLFYKYTGQVDIVLGFPIYGRDYPGLKESVGFFADTLPLRTRFSEDDTFIELLNNVTEKAFNAYENKDYPFEELINELNPTRDLSRTNLFDVFVILQNFEHLNEKEGVLHCEKLRVKEYKKLDEGYPSFDLLFNFHELKDGLGFSLEYDKSIFKADTIERLMLHLEILMELVIENSKPSISELDVLSTSDEKELLAFGNSTCNHNKDQKKASKDEEKNKPNDLKFSLFYFGNAGGEYNQYQLLLDGAEYADKNGYTAVWTPERHFDVFGGPYPNPSVLGAALACKTKNIGIRSGSIVAPLHNAIRIAEEWSVVDNLSNGRAGICLASGWNINDFVLSPQSFQNRCNLLYEKIDQVKKLWVGNSLKLENSNGKEIEVRILPKPVQKELPIWIASGGNIETFISAGKIGASILTMLSGNSTLKELETKIKAYREAYKKHGHSLGNDNVVLMLHSFVAKTKEEAVSIAKEPLKKYLGTSIKMSKKAKGEFLESQTHEEANMVEFLEYVTDQYIRDFSLIGSPKSCQKILQEASNTGVDEIACLVDFGVDYDRVMQSLEFLTETKKIFGNRFNTLNCQSKNFNNYENNVVKTFSKQVLKTPNYVALKCEDKELTYLQLEKKSNQLVNYLKKNNVKSRDIIPFYVDRSVEMMIGMLAVFKLGAIYVPIDTKYPEKRRDYILNDVKARHVLTQKKYKGIFGGDAQELFVDDETIATTSNEKKDVDVNGDDLACIFYTSGSTGVPKGIVMKHKNVWAFFDGKGQIQQGQDQLIFSVLSSNAFDVFLFETLFPLTKGGTTVLFTNNEILKTNYLSEKLLTVNTVHIVPALMTELVNYIKNQPERKDYSNIKDIFIGADFVSLSLLKDVKAIFKNANIHVLYGVTETTIYATTHTISKGDHLLENTSEGIIGRPDKNVSIYILNKNKKLVPTGVIGEIYIGGGGVSEGYHKNKDLTREKFTINSYKEKEIIYQTGDLGRWLSDETIQIIGRKDTQVKIRGYRIELGEIEQKLLKLENIVSSAVVVKTGLQNEKQIVAYIVANEKKNIEELRSELGKSLPNYMIPAFFIQLDKMPLNDNNKIDRKRLRELQDDYIQINNKYKIPENNIQEKLLKLWKDVLGLPEISIQDDFFALGGHSLIATKLIAKIELEFGIIINVNLIFNYPTIERMGNEIYKIILVSSKPLFEREVENVLL